jgi:uncharacterized damage-inducible protein DinB
MTLNPLTDLYRHMAWADALLWSAVAESAAARADEKVQATLYHVHLVQHAFLRAWRGRPAETDFPTFTGLEPLLTWGQAFHEDAAAYVQGLAIDDVSQPMPLAWAAVVEEAIGRVPAPTTVGDTLLQVALHSVHHRGQVNVRLRELGATPPLLDYIGWVWYGRPAAEWPRSIAD